MLIELLDLAVMASVAAILAFCVVAILPDSFYNYINRKGIL